MSESEPAHETSVALDALTAIEDSEGADAVVVSVRERSARLPPTAVEALKVVLRVLSRGSGLVVMPDVIEAVDRPRCAACGESVVLGIPDDPESWVHAPDANDAGDHTAWID